MLINLAEDVTEMNNVATKHPERVQKMLNFATGNAK